jgi:hypothetical protein
MLPRVGGGFVELLHGTPATLAERQRLIAESEERRRARPTARQQAPSPRDPAARTEAQDADTMRVMLGDAGRAGADDHEQADGAGQDNEAASERLRPRRPRPTRLDAASNDPTEL